MLAKSDIIVYVPVYNDRDALNRCLNELDRIGLVALVGDGRYLDFPQINNSDYSTDGTENLCNNRAHQYFSTKPCREEEKLNMAMNIAHRLKYKVLMYIGADSFLAGNIDEFMINLSREYERFVAVTTILLIEAVELQPDAKWNNTGTRQPRILFNYDRLEARHLHWALYEKGARDDEPFVPESIIVQGLKIFHDNSIRPKDRDDMMTAYQNTNVPRERAMYEKHVAKQAYEKISILDCVLDENLSYSQARQNCIIGGFSHLIVSRHQITKDTVQKFKEAIEIRNSMLYNIPILCSVFDVDGKRFTLDPEEKYLNQLPDYPKIKEMYSKNGILPDGKFMAVPWTCGSVICMDYNVVRAIEIMGTDIDFMTFTNSLGFVTQAVTDIRV